MVKGVKGVKEVKEVKGVKGIKGVKGLLIGYQPVSNQLSHVLMETQCNLPVTYRLLTVTDLLVPVSNRLLTG